MNKRFVLIALLSALLLIKIVAFAGCGRSSSPSDAGTSFHAGAYQPTAPLPSTGTGYAHVTNGAFDPVVSDWISVGGQLGGGYIPPSSGLIRLPNSNVTGTSSVGIMFRNANNSQDIPGMSFDTTNTLNIGQGTGLTAAFGINISSGNNIVYYTGGDHIFNVGNTTAFIMTANLTEVNPIAFTTQPANNGFPFPIIGGGNSQPLNAVASQGKFRRLASPVSTMTIAAGSAAGSSPSVSVAGDDITGVITVTPGSGATTGTLVTVGFYWPMNDIPHVFIQPAETNAWALPYGRVVVLDANNTINQFVLTVVGSGLSPSTQYKWIFRTEGG